MISKIKKNKGITLIALVITIIVLLILAGVTIVAIGGNENIISKANEAKQKDAIAAAKDEIILEAHNALLQYYNGKYVNQTSSGQSQTSMQSAVATAVTTVVNNIKNRNAEFNQSSVNGNIITLKINSFQAIGTIDEDGIITWEDGNIEGAKIKVGNETIDLSTLDSSTVGQYYGTEIVTIDNVKYSLYYVDYAGYFGERGTVYLKAITSVSDFMPNAHMITDNDAKIEAVRIMGLLNPDWKKNVGTITYDSMESNEQGAANLCNPSHSLWSGIKTAFENKYGASNVNYVVGDPSVEMLTKAINEAGGLTGSNALDARWFAAKDTNNISTTSPYTYAGYLYSVTGKNTNSNTGYGYLEQTSAQKGALTNAQKAMYYNNTNQWFASPASDNNNYCVNFISTNGDLTGTGWNRIYSVCPLISLKPGVDLTK